MERAVLFVCMGNICRSPIAEEVFRTLIVERGADDRVRVDSAGVTDYHAGERADVRMCEAAAGRGYVLQSRSRAVTGRDIEVFDLVIAMDRDNLADLRSLVPPDGAHEHVRLMSDFLPGKKPVDVPDPYYGGRQGFDRVIDLVEEACPAILGHLLDENDRSETAR